ncbi:hypothetical protein XELAEV_18031341mg [Xenopus laevis]|uniref:Reverse transcriptase domain-containing protein n=1 Tax=Xenopus laevis TaxID=8355 RepID=A0A974CNM5_XENLA|nr:hypothetical protein XELAEV_18031341mg [Xenopus laevis]
MAESATLEALLAQVTEAAKKDGGTWLRQAFLAASTSEQAGQAAEIPARTRARRSKAPARLNPSPAGGRKRVAKRRVPSASPHAVPISPDGSPSRAARRGSGSPSISSDSGREDLAEPLPSTSRSLVGAAGRVGISRSERAQQAAGLHTRNQPAPQDAERHTEPKGVSRLIDVQIAFGTQDPLMLPTIETTQERRLLPSTKKVYVGSTTNAPFAEACTPRRGQRLANQPSPLPQKASTPDGIVPQIKETPLLGYPKRQYPNKRESLIIHDGFLRGFWIPFSPSEEPTWAENLKSTWDNEHTVWEKLSKELQMGRMAGPFPEPPFHNLRVSPLGLVPKKEPGKFRLIHHLSFPKGSSVNDGIDSDESRVQYTSFDGALELVRGAGKGALMAKSDIESAFRLLPVHPECFHLLGCALGGAYFVDMCLPMGCSISCYYFKLFSSFLEWVVGHETGSTRASIRTYTRQLDIPINMASVRWRGISGLLWPQVFPEFLHIQRTTPGPKVVVIHAGGNDLGVGRNVDLIHTIKQDLYRYATFARNCVVVWSEIIYRQTWRYARNQVAIDRCRKKLNVAVSALRQHCRCWGTNPAKGFLLAELVVAICNT